MAVDNLDVIERCPGRVTPGRHERPCHRRAGHHGHCATGGSYAKALDERDDALQQLRGAVDLLREVAGSGVEFDDERIGYVTVQIDRPTWDALAPYRAGGR